MPVVLDRLCRQARQLAAAPWPLRVIGGGDSSMRKLQSVALVIGVLLSTTLLIPLPPAAASSWSGYARIENSQSTRCLGIAADGNAGIWDCTTNNDQEWKQGLQYYDIGSSRHIDYYQLVNKTGKCLGISGHSGAQGARVVAQGCDGSPTQGWRIDDQQNMAAVMTNLGSGRDLAVSNGAIANGSAVIQWYSPGNDGFWGLSPGLPFSPWSGSVRIFNNNSSRCLGIAADGNAGIWTCTTKP